jgi:TonB family protein
MSPPEYPPSARAAQIQGEVAVDIQIDREGNVIEAKADSGHRLLQKYAQENIRAWKFRRYGSSVTYPFRHRITYSYRLEGIPIYPVHYGVVTLRMPDRVEVVSPPMALQID